MVSRKRPHLPQKPARLPTVRNPAEGRGVVAMERCQDGCVTHLSAGKSGEARMPASGFTCVRFVPKPPACPTGCRQAVGRTAGGYGARAGRYLPWSVHPRKKFRWGFCENRFRWRSETCVDH